MESKNIKIVIVQRILTSYRKVLFDELAERFDLTVLHSADNSGIKQVSADYSRIVPSFAYYSRPTTLFLNVFPFIRKIRPRVIIHENAIGIMSLFPLFLMCKLLHIKLILWGQGFDRYNGFSPRNSLMDKIRLFYMKNCDAVIFYGIEGKDTIKDFISENKLFVAPNTVNTPLFLKIKEKFDQLGRDTLKSKMGFKFRYNLIFIGRLLKEKYPEKVFEVYEHIKARFNNDLGIHFVGDGEMMNELKSIAKAKDYEDNVIFHGAVFDDTLTGELLYCSDIMLMPGCVGLSVNHAFCFGCPVVTFDQKGNGPEAAYIISGKTGYLASPYNIDEMSNWVENYLLDETRQVETKQYIKEMVLNVCSLDNMVHGFEEAINYSIN